MIDDVDIASLRAAERVGIGSAGTSRVRGEFASGRALMRCLIGRDVELPIGHDRRPVLPDGFVGSLAHDHQIAIAAVAASDEFTALGIDLEPSRLIDDEMAEIILRPEESAIDPVLAFCLKEAAYKAWSNAGGGFLEHHDVSIALDGSRFIAVVLPCRLTLQGGWAHVAGRWIAHVAIPVSTSSAPDRRPASQVEPVVHSRSRPTRPMNPVGWRAWFNSLGGVGSTYWARSSPADARTVVRTVTGRSCGERSMTGSTCTTIEAARMGDATRADGQR